MNVNPLASPNRNRRCQRQRERPLNTVPATPVEPGAATAAPRRMVVGQRFYVVQQATFVTGKKRIGDRGVVIAHRHGDLSCSPGSREHTPGLWMALFARLPTQPQGLVGVWNVLARRPARGAVPVTRAIPEGGRRGFDPTGGAPPRGAAGQTRETRRSPATRRFFCRKYDGRPLGAVGFVVYFLKCNIPYFEEFDAPCAGIAASRLSPWHRRSSV